MTTRAGLALLLGLGALLCLPAGAQEPAKTELPAWAPRWRKGDWWVIKTYQRDLGERTTSSAPADGGTPRTPDDPRREPLPGLPPLDDGVPQGWKKANTFRFEVARRELVRYPDDGPGDAPEPFLVVAVRTLEGEPPRTAELWYAEADLTLARVILGPQSDRPRARDVSGTVQLDPPETADLGFPLDWPDFVAAARQPTAELQVEGQGLVEQRVRAAGQAPNEEVQLRLALKTGPNEEDTRARVLITFRKDGGPFWSRLVGPMYSAELVEQGRGR